MKHMVETERQGGFLAGKVEKCFRERKDLKASVVVWKDGSSKVISFSLTFC